ncbi:MAG: GNAT family N-acetyltransferase [Bacteroidetes bacterium]|nr:GNAT family N-acetyltransferase [Bacteroidota bacterium]MCL2301801.1 GNAT family N-acetyltransferase [Lentimicrobiaceae bacterium]
MKKIIPPVDINLLEQELTEDKFLRVTNAGNNSIYIVTAHDAPNVMRELGRLRELTFRAAGGGTGKEMDIDEYDTAEVPFKQLIVWSNDNKEIVSSYRFIFGKEVPLDENGYPHTPTSKLFHFSKKFIEGKWLKTIELGRSFVQPKYQGTTNPRLGLFSLDNLWDGLGTLAVDYPDVKFFLGKMTMYNSYNRLARNLILFFLRKYFRGDKNLIAPIHAATGDKRKQVFRSIFRNGTYKEDFKILNDNIRDLKTTIPPLIKSYMSLSSTMRCFGVSANPEFGPVEEIAIMIKIADINEDKKKRYIYSYKKKKKQKTESRKEKA